jgi:hypothetical protein
MRTNHDEAVWSHDHQYDRLHVLAVVDVHIPSFLTSFRSIAFVASPVLALLGPGRHDQNSCNTTGHPSRNTHILRYPS